MLTIQMIMNIVIWLYSYEYIKGKKHKKIERELHISHLKGCKESETENRMGLENIL